MEKVAIQTFSLVNWINCLRGIFCRFLLACMALVRFHEILVNDFSIYGLDYTAFFVFYWERIYEKMDKSALSCL